MDPLENLRKKISEINNINDKNTSESSTSNTSESSTSNTSESSKQNIKQKRWSKHSWWIPLPLFSILSISLILLFSQIPFFNCQDGYNLNQSSTILSSTPIKLDSTRYAVGQVVHIINNSKLSGETLLEIKRTHFPSKIPGCFIPLERESTFALIKINEGQANYTYIPTQPGLYVINTYNSSQQKEFQSIFEVINPIASTTFIMLILVIAFFIALVTLTFILSIMNKNLNNEKMSIENIMNSNYRKKYLDKFSSLSLEELVKDITRMEYVKREIEGKYERKMLDYIEIASSLRFLFISALVWSIVFALIFNDVEIGTHSPFGLVLRHNLNPEGGEVDANKNPLFDWVINIGGNWKNNFSSGIIIPVYVFILGLIGGYLRYLHKTATKEKSISEAKKEKITKDKTLTESERQIRTSDKPTENTSSDFLENTFGELAHVFLSPLLAAVVWFIISQGKTDFNIYTMAAVSFSIGLVTTEITQIIVNFMERIIPTGKTT